MGIRTGAKLLPLKEYEINLDLLMKFLGIIPARYASSRFPGKPLVEIQGKSMIQRVYEQALKSNKLSKVIVATDDRRIEKHVKNFGGNVIMTSASHKTGTERCNEVLEKSGPEKWDSIINIQGDEPFINPAQIDAVCNCFNTKGTQIASLVKQISNREELFNSNVVKAVIDKNKNALYFTRAAIPFMRDEKPEKWLANQNYYKHIGIYGYATVILKKITQLKPSTLEIAESLEQLRWLENGYKIKVEITIYDSIAVDTPEDLKKILSKLEL